MKTLNKTKLLSVIIIFIGFTFTARAEQISCEGKVDFYGEVQTFSVLIQGQGIGQAYTKSQVDRIEVQGASLEAPNVFLNATDYWDGHANGMITAPGFSMSYEHVVGCIRNVIVTTDFRGDVKNVGATVGHLTQSQIIATCKNDNTFCK